MSAALDAKLAGVEKLIATHKEDLGKDHTKLDERITNLEKECVKLQYIKDHYTTKDRFYLVGGAGLLSLGTALIAAYIFETPKMIDYSEFNAKLDKITKFIDSIDR